MEGSEGSGIHQRRSEAVGVGQAEGITAWEVTAGPAGAAGVAVVGAAAADGFAADRLSADRAGLAAELTGSAIAVNADRNARTAERRASPAAAGPGRPCLWEPCAKQSRGLGP